MSKESGHGLGVSPIKEPRHGKTWKDYLMSTHWYSFLNLNLGKENKELPPLPPPLADGTRQVLVTIPRLGRMHGR
jgi:hypothetical protein